MSEVEQKRLYAHYKKLSVEGETSKQRIRHKGYAAEILKSFPQFEVKEKPKSDKPKSDKPKGGK